MILYLATIIAIASAKTSGTTTSSYGYSTTPTAYVAGGTYMSSRNHNNQYYRSGDSSCGSTVCGQTTCGASGEVESLCTFTEGTCTSHGCQSITTEQQCQEAATAAGLSMSNFCTTSNVGACTTDSSATVVNYCSSTYTSTCSSSASCLCWCVVEDIWSEENDAGTIVGIVFGVLFCLCCAGAICYCMMQSNSGGGGYAKEFEPYVPEPKYMQVYDQNGIPMMGVNGQPAYEDVAQYIKWHENTEEEGGPMKQYVILPRKDQNGCFMYDEDGNQLFQEEREYIPYYPPAAMNVDDYQMEGEMNTTAWGQTDNTYMQQDQPMMMQTQQPYMQQTQQPYMQQTQQPYMQQGQPQYIQPNYGQQPMMMQQQPVQMQQQPVLSQPPPTYAQPPQTQPPNPYLNNAQTIGDNNNNNGGADNE